jgi:hypothetical protein
MAIRRHASRHARAWLQFAVASPRVGEPLGDVAAGIDGDDPRLAVVGCTFAPAHRCGATWPRR